MQKVLFALKDQGLVLEFVVSVQVFNNMLMSQRNILVFFKNNVAIRLLVNVGFMMQVWVRVMWMFMMNM